MYFLIVDFGFLKHIKPSHLIILQTNLGLLCDQLSKSILNSSGIKILLNASDFFLSSSIF